MPQLSFDEIKSWQQFEELTACYFRFIKEAKGTNLMDVQVTRSGVGVDNGVDILVKCTCSDGISSFVRTWVVQCKFTNKPVSMADINRINIPTLLASRNACGYLLVCKDAPTSGLIASFENLKNEMKDKHFEVWSGEQFRSNLLIAPVALLQQFFPKYAKAMEDVLKINQL